MCFLVIFLGKDYIYLLKADDIVYQMLGKRYMSHNVYKKYSFGVDLNNSDVRVEDEG